MSGPEPIWNPERHLDAVYRRGRQLRRRRRLAFASGPLLVVGLAVVAVAGLPAPSKSNVLTAAGHGGNQSSEGRATNGSADGGAGGGSLAQTGTHDRGGAAPADPSSGGNGGQAGGSVPGTPAPGGSSPVGAGPGSPGSVSPGSSPSNGSASPKTGAGPNTAAPTAASTCAASDLQYTTHTDRSRYASGQSVNVTLVVTNRGSRPCNAPSPCGVGPWATVQNAAGTVVWQSHPLATMCSNPPPVAHLGPGQSATYGAGSWDQAICTSAGVCSPAPSGTYTATAHRADVTAAATRFRIS